MNTLTVVDPERQPLPDSQAATGAPGHRGRPTDPEAGRRRRHVGRLSTRTAFVLLVSMAVFFLAASSAPTPLYAIYQAKWGFSPITVTVVFGIYAIAVLGALLVVGSLSDHIGRRPVLWVAIVLQAAAMVIFATAGDVPTLIVGRIVQGIATGGALGAIGAGLLDLDKRKGTIASGVGTVAGTAVGALGSALMVQFLPAPTHLVYLALFGIFLLQAAGVALMGEPSTKEAGRASLRPQFALPRAARRPMVVAVPVLVAVWALAGFYGSLGPTLVRLLTDSPSVVFGGLSLFALAASGALTVLLARNMATRGALFLGIIALIVGVAVTVLAVAVTSSIAFFLGTIVAGVGFGAGFQGALRSVLPLAAPHERAGVLSTIYVVSYLALGLPAVVAGFFVAHGSGVRATAKDYGMIVIALAVAALVGLVTQSSDRSVEATMAAATAEPGKRPGPWTVSVDTSSPRRHSDTSSVARLVSCDAG
jgi:MFS family permease